MQRKNGAIHTGLREAIMMAFILTLMPLSNASALGLSSYTGIQEISLGTGNKPIFRVINAGDAGTGCASDAWIRFPDLAAYDGNRRIYQMIVNAFLNDKAVLIETRSCDGEYPLLHRVWVRRDAAPRPD